MGCGLGSHHCTSLEDIWWGSKGQTITFIKLLVCSGLVGSWSWDSVVGQCSRVAGRNREPFYKGQPGWMSLSPARSLKTVSKYSQAWNLTLFYMGKNDLGLIAFAYFSFFLTLSCLFGFSTKKSEHKALFLLILDMDFCNLWAKHAAGWCPASLAASDTVVPSFPF